MFNNVLVINDNDILLFTAKKMFSKANSQTTITTAGNGKIGFDYLQQLLLERSTTIPELIILDLHMPIMDGWEFLEVYNNELSHQLPDTKIIILSASVNPEDMQQIQKYHFVLGDIIDAIHLGTIAEMQRRFSDAKSVNAHRSCHMVA